MTSRVVAALVGCVVVTSTVLDGRAQIAIPVGAVVLPMTPRRPTVAAIVASSATSAAATGDALKLNGIAYLPVVTDATTSVDERLRHLVDRLVALRNDARFPTMVVVGQGSDAAMAAVATRLARADGFVAVTPQNAAGDIARLIVPVFNAKDGAAAAKDIADFARGVPPLGLRGGHRARPDTPRRSLRDVTYATVGGSLVGLEYGRPHKRGREIWGGIVRWDHEWMPGADEATTLTTSVPLRIGQLTVPAGDHTFYFLPGENKSQLLVSNDVGQYHEVFDSSLVLGRVDMAVQTRAQFVEELTFAIEPHGDGATLRLIWDDREFSAAMAVVKQ